MPDMIYKCPKCGLKDWAKGKCPFDGYQFVFSHLVGLPISSTGATTVIGDKLPRHYDWAAGCWIDSKSARKRIYAAKGLRLKSWKEHVRQHGTTGRKPKVVSYAGQGKHTSSAEREGVWTGDGRRVV